jgi:mono/diheme cytochrome c family protein
VAPATAAAKPAAAAPASPEPAAPPPPPPPYIEAAIRRKRIPYWAMPVLALLPIWAIFYAGSLSPADTGEATPLDLGAEIYSSQCAACHGGSGGGGVGRPLDAGQVLATFPTIESQLQFVAVGTAGIGAGNPYGDPDREGGPHIAGDFGNMPAFGESLTGEELLAVVRYEREVLSGEELQEDEIGEGGTRNWSTGEAMINEGGELISPAGEDLFGEDGSLSYQAGDATPAEEAAD